MDLLGWALFLLLGWGRASERTPADTREASVSAPAMRAGTEQMKASHDGTPIPPR